MKMHVHLEILVQRRCKAFLPAGVAKPRSRPPAGHGQLCAQADDLAVSQSAHKRPAPAHAPGTSPTLRCFPQDSAVGRHPRQVLVPRLTGVAVGASRGRTQADPEDSPSGADDAPPRARHTACVRASHDEGTAVCAPLRAPSTAHSRTLISACSLPGPLTPRAPGGDSGSPGPALYRDSGGAPPTT